MRRGVAAAEAVTVEALVGQREGATQESVGPVRIDAAAVAKNVDGATGVGAAQEDDLAGRNGGVVGPPAGRERSAERPIGLSALTQMTDVSVDETLAAGAQLGQRNEVETVPDLALPQAIEVFDGGLKTRLTRRGKHRGDAQRKTEADDSADGAGRMARPMKRRSLSN
jgi:hypothetical protein